MTLTVMQPIIKRYGIYNKDMRSNKVSVNLERYPIMFVFRLTHRGLVTTYGDIDLGQHWLRQWPVADGTKPLPDPMLTNHQ